MFKSGGAARTLLLFADASATLLRSASHCSARRRPVGLRTHTSVLKTDFSNVALHWPGPALRSRRGDEAPAFSREHVCAPAGPTGGAGNRQTTLPDCPPSENKISGLKRKVGRSMWAPVSQEHPGREIWASGTVSPSLFLPFLLAEC